MADVARLAQDTKASAIRQRDDVQYSADVPQGGAATTIQRCARRKHMRRLVAG